MRLLFASLLIALSTTAFAQDLTVLSADATAQALARGARVVDVRSPAQYQAGHLPGAVALDPVAATQDVASLQAMVSVLGIDLSREVVIVGEPGDLQALRLQHCLAAYATGQVGWLVGGAHEWALSGRPLHTAAVRLPAVPQHLVLLAATVPAPRMAGASLREVPVAQGAAVVASAYL